MGSPAQNCAGLEQWMPDPSDKFRAKVPTIVGLMISTDERALCARLAAGSGSISPEMIAAARRHRMHLLLADSAAPRDCPPDILTDLKRSLVVAAGLDAWHERELRELLDALAEARIDALLFKGAALGYTLYTHPHLRPRIDADILVRESHNDDAGRVLQARSWTRPPEPDAEIVAAQRHYIKRAPANADAHVDLHWKVANPHVFADALSFDDLWQRSVPVPALGSSARAVGVVDALLIACVHRIAHHGDAIDLLWLWDIHLLTGGLSTGDRNEFIALAQRTKMAAVCERGIALASNAFGTPGADDVLQGLTARSGVEKSARFIGGVTPATVLREDLVALPTWRARARLISEHLFPSVAYMRSRYPRCPQVLLPLAYVARIALGAPKWVRRHGFTQSTR
jgi:Uncharacterised nucleotidyltransferase